MAIKKIDNYLEAYLKELRILKELKKAEKEVSGADVKMIISNQISVRARSLECLRSSITKELVALEAEAVSIPEEPKEDPVDLAESCEEEPEEEKSSLYLYEEKKEEPVEEVKKEEPVEIKAEEKKPVVAPKKASIYRIKGDK